MSTFSTYWVIELMKSGAWKPADDCAYSSGMPVQAAALWAGRDGNQGVRIVQYDCMAPMTVAEWDSAGTRTL